LFCFGEDFCFLAHGDENRRIVVRADARKAAADNVLGLRRAGAIRVEDFGDRFGHIRLRMAQRADPGDRVRRALCAHSRRFRKSPGRLRRAGQPPIFEAVFHSSLMTWCFVRTGGA
jgi:hypothetical protein